MFKKLLLMVSIFAIVPAQGNPWLIKGLYHGGRALSVGIPLSYAAQNIYGYLGYRKYMPEYVRLLPNAPVKVDEWIQGHVRNCGYSGVSVKVRTHDIYGKKIDPQHDHPVRMKSSSLQDVIYIDPSAAKRIETNLALGDSEIAEDEENYMNYMAFISHHEVGHLKHKDNHAMHKLPVMVAVPLGVQLASWGVNSLRKSKAMPGTVRFAGAFFAANILFGFGKQEINKVLSSLHTRHVEASADQFALQKVQSPEILRGAAFIFESKAGENVFQSLGKQYDAHGKLDYQKMAEDFAASGPVAQKFIAEWSGWRQDPNHPHAARRSIKLRERADELEKMAQS